MKTTVLLAALLVSYLFPLSSYGTGDYGTTSGLVREPEPGKCTRKIDAMTATPSGIPDGLSSGTRPAKPKTEGNRNKKLIPAGPDKAEEKKNPVKISLWYCAAGSDVF